MFWLINICNTHKTWKKRYFIFAATTHTLMRCLDIDIACQIHLFALKLEYKNYKNQIVYQGNPLPNKLTILKGKKENN